MLEFLGENIYEICVGIGLILTTIFGRNKNLTSEEKAAVKIEKIRRKGEKATAKAQKLANELKELEGE